MHAYVLVYMHALFCHSSVYIDKRVHYSSDAQNEVSMYVIWLPFSSFTNWLPVNRVEFCCDVSGRDGSPTFGTLGLPQLTSGPPRSQGLSSSHTPARILLPVRRKKFGDLTSAESGRLCLQSVRFSSGVLDTSENARKTKKQKN